MPNHSERATTRTRRSYAPSSFERAMAVLECFSLPEPELTAGEIGRKVGLATSTLYRYLSAMEDEGYLQRDAGTNKYTVGLRVVELAGVALSRLDVRRHGQVELDSLADSLDMNANVGVLYRGDTFHLAFAVRTEVDRMHTVIGRRTPATNTAMGKAMLSHLPRLEVHALVERCGWRPRTPNSITAFERLDLELNEVLRTGYALDRGEVRPHQWCVAAPVRELGGQVVAAISVSADRERVQPALEHVIRTVCTHAEQLSRRLGYSGM